MDKRVLMVASVPSMIGSFNMDNIRILLDMGYVVDVACNFTDVSVWPEEKSERLKKELNELNIECLQLNFSRSPLHINGHVKSYKETLRLLRERKYLFIHTHTPTASAIVRMAAHKTGTRVIYTAHGFHFYKGAPLKNWLLFYPIEKWLSNYTNTLITITREDYKRAKKKFRAKRTVYVPGIGVDIERFTHKENDRDKIRAELGISDARIMVLSVGELNENKNHVSVIKAISGLGLVYVVVGKGVLDSKLKATAEKCDVDLRLMGFRNDVIGFYNAADVYVLPSVREGLNVSLMEAMSCGLPVACGNIRGNTDLIDNNACLFSPKNEGEIRRAICAALDGKNELGMKNREKIHSFDKSVVIRKIRDVYEKMAINL